MGLKKHFKVLEKTIQAPPYFREHQKEMDKMDQVVADMCELSIYWVRAQMQKPPKAFQQAMKEIAKEKGWTKEQITKAEILINASFYYSHYCSARFQWENRDTKWGKAELLYYDKERDMMVMHWLIPRIKKAVKSILLATKGGKIIGEKKVEE